MRTKLKVLSSILTVFVVFSMFSFGVAADDFTYSFSSDGTLNIRATGGNINLGFMYDVEMSEVKKVNVDISGLSFEYLTLEIWGFDDCAATEVNVTGKNSGTIELTKIFNFPYATKISIPSGITYSHLMIQNTKIANLDFLKNHTVNQLEIRNCNLLTSATIYTANSKFYAENCSVLKTVVFPSKMDRIHFKGNSKLTNVTLPTTVTDYYWYNCTCSTITVPNATSEVKVSGTKLTTVSFASNVTKIKSYSFEDCTNLTTVNIPVSVKEIQAYAFSNCKVPTVNYAGTQAQWKKVSVDSASGLSSATIKYNGSSSQPKNGWYTEDGHKRYYENDKVVTGWKSISNSWYFFDASGNMSTGWVQDGGKYYYFGTDGTMKTRWQNISNAWYYFNTSGDMVTGWKAINGKWYYFNTNGSMSSGWKAISGKWYYFNPDGDMVTGWKKLGNDYYFFKSDGSMAAKEYCDGYWLDEDGRWTYQARASWKQDSTGWYFQDTTGWYARNQSLKINNKVYNFNSAGYCTNP